MIFYKAYWRNMGESVAKEGDQPKERQAAQARKKVIDEELARYIRLLKEHGPPEKVILFGTIAGGQVHKWSDIERLFINMESDRWL
jgi:hypothetical protein